MDFSTSAVRTENRSQSRQDTTRKSRRQSTMLTEALSQCRRSYTQLVLFSLVINLLVLVSPLYMMQIFDRVLSSGSIETLIALSLLTATALAFMGLFDTLRSRHLSRTGMWLDEVLSPHVARAGINARLSGSAPEGKPNQDLAVLKGFLGGNALKAIADSIWSPAFFVVLWLLHPVIGITSIAFGLALVMLALINEVLTRQHSFEASGSNVKNTQKLEQFWQNADAVKAMGMSGNFLKHWEADKQRTQSLQKSVNDTSSNISGISRFIRLLAQMAILGIGAWLVIEQALTPGAMIAGSILLSRALAPTEQAIGAWKGLLSARSARARLETWSRFMPDDTSRTELPAPSGQLNVDNVTYMPGPFGPPTISSISFSVEPGETIGVVGPSASGKTTLCKLLVGCLSGYHGDIRIDGAELKQWDTDFLGKYIGYLPQDVQLFSGTVGSNIARLDNEANADDIIDASRTAGVHELILKLPDGYDTEIGAGGAGLSGGQRQRVALARAIYGNPRILVLDEPNSNLDNDGERALLAALDKLKTRGTTVFIVAHHARIMRSVDKILLLQEGRLEGFSPREEVLVRKLPDPQPISELETDFKPAEAPEQQIASAGQRGKSGISAIWKQGTRPTPAVSNPDEKTDNPDKPATEDSR